MANTSKQVTLQTRPPIQAPLGPVLGRAALCSVSNVARDHDSRPRYYSNRVTRPEIEPTQSSTEVSVTSSQACPTAIPGPS
jgi:hypothetical protein